jgi:predicted RNA binding protein YcfA (HicA-like mRNA interferase family)
MKRADLIARLTKMGCELVRHGGKHDFYRQSITGKSQPVPRHREINELLARKILRYLDPANQEGS